MHVWFYNTLSKLLFLESGLMPLPNFNPDVMWSKSIFRGLSSQHNADRITDDGNCTRQSVVQVAPVHMYIVSK